MELRTQAVPGSVFSTKIDLLHRYYTVGSFRQLHAEEAEQLLCTIVLSDDGPVRLEICRTSCVVIL